MNKNGINNSVLFRTSAASDIQCSGGNVTIAGLPNGSISKKTITGIYQQFYHAEVPQVVTVGATAYTPDGATVYAVQVYDPLRNTGSYGESPKPYAYTTPDDITELGATAALQREAISLAIVAAINDDVSNHAVAASLGLGNGFTITDDGGYYPPFSQSMTNVKGPNKVLAVSGFAPTNISVTTAAVLSSGVGANLAAQKPVINFTFGNLISGELIAPPVTSTGLPAVSGQNYDMFGIESLTMVPISNVTGQWGYQTRTSYIFVDNGTGTNTANLAGFKAFERVMHKLMAEQYVNDASSVVEFFDQPIVFQDPLGAAPTGTANTLGWQMGRYTSLNRTNIGTQTIVAPVLNSTGLLIDQDDTATEGSHTSANQQALGDQSVIVGKSEYSVNCRVVMGDYTDAAFMIGLRKKAVYDATINNYTDYATIGNGSSVAGTTWINGDLFVTRAALNGGSTTQAISAVAPADGVSYYCQVKVDINGVCTAFVNGTSYPIYSTGTTTMTFDAGDELIAFYQIVNIGSGDPACSISEFVCVPTLSFAS